MDTITLTPDEAARVLGVLLLLHHGKAAPLTGADAALLQQARTSLASQLGVPADMLPQGEGSGQAKPGTETIWLVNSIHVSESCWDNICNDAGGVPHTKRLNDDSYLVEVDVGMSDYDELTAILKRAEADGYTWLRMHDNITRDPSLTVYDGDEPEEDDE